MALGILKTGEKHPDFKKDINSDIKRTHYAMFLTYIHLKHLFITKLKLN